MTKPSIDRRAARTRASLTQAHLRLIREKGYDATTIKDICDSANVGRSTFYAHYANKDDLKRSGLEQLRRELIERQAEPAQADVPRCLRFSLPMFEHARANIDLYRALVGNRGGVVALEAIRQILSDLVRQDLPAMVAMESREAVVRYIVGAYMAMLTWWLDGGARATPQYMNALFCRLATSGVAAGANLG